MRNTYIILPLKATTPFDIRTYAPTFADQTDDEKKLRALNADILNFYIPSAEEIGFDSDSLSDLVRHKCDSQQGFVRRFRLNRESITADFSDGYSLAVQDIQLTVFENGIGFLTVMFCVPEEEIKRIYDFVNPGYLKDKDADLQERFITLLRTQVLKDTRFDFYVEGEDKKLAIKESYLLNAAFTDRRYDELEELDRATFNVHKLIGVEEDFTDASEADIAYTYGARDVENKTFRWGCCISSQSISFVYGPSNSNYDTSIRKSIKPAEELSVKDMLATAEDDLLLTILALYQTQTCRMLSESIQRELHEKGAKQKSIRAIKNEVLRFRAYDTITPSQISRWNNVCETYRYLLQMNGVEEAFSDVSEKVSLIDEEIERISAERQNYFATIIAVFGLTSIVASVLQIVDYVEPQDPTMLLWTGISCVGIAAMVIAWLIMVLKNR